MTQGYLEYTQTTHTHTCIHTNHTHSHTHTMSYKPHTVTHIHTNRTQSHTYIQTHTHSHTHTYKPHTQYTHTNHTHSHTHTYKPHTQYTHTYKPYTQSHTYIQTHTHSHTQSHTNTHWQALVHGDATPVHSLKSILLIVPHTPDDYDLTRGEFGHGTRETCYRDVFDTQPRVSQRGVHMKSS